jgi:hypothetical protein
MRPAIGVAMIFATMMILLKTLVPFGMVSIIVGAMVAVGLNRKGSAMVTLFPTVLPTGFRVNRKLALALVVVSASFVLGVVVGSVVIK